MSEVQRFSIGGKEAFLVTNKEDWARLTSAGHMVYTSDEVKYARDHPELVDEEVKDLLLKLKSVLPTTILMKVRTNDTTD